MSVSARRAECSIEVSTAVRSTVLNDSAREPISSVEDVSTFGMAPANASGVGLRRLSSTSGSRSTAIEWAESVTCWSRRLRLRPSR